jgi:hypothetical protein
MKTCPYCDKEVSFWRVWQAATIYRCPCCGKASRIALASQFLFAVVVLLPVLILAVGLVAYLDVRSWAMRTLVMVAVAFGASLLLKFLLAHFGRFDAYDTQ